MRRYSLFLLLLVVGTLCFAQTPDTLYREINELLAARKYAEAAVAVEQEEKELDRLVEPLNHAQLMLHKGKALTHQYKMDAALATYDSLAAFGHEQGIDLIEVWGLNAACAITEFQGKFELVEKSARRIVEIGPIDSACYSDAHTNLAYSFQRSGQADSALWAIYRAIELDSLSNALRSIPFNYSFAAVIYESMGDLDNAMVALEKGYSLLRDGVDDFKKATFEFELADLFLAQSNLTKAKEYALKGRISATKNDVRSKLAEIDLVLGHIAVAEDSLKMARENYTKALPYLLEKKISRLLISVYSALAEISITEEDGPRAEQALKDAKYWAQKETDMPRRLSYYAALTRYHIAKGEVNKAATSFTVVSKNRVFGRSMYADLSYYKLAYLLRREQGSYREALAISDRISSIKDSLFHVEQTRSVNEMEGRFNKAQNEKEIARLDAERVVQDLALEQKDFQIKAGIIIGIGLLILGLFMLHQYRTIKRINNQVNDKNKIISVALEEKELLLREIHHRVKNNLQVISSLLSLQSREIKDEAALEAVNESRNRVKSMALIHQNLYKENDLTGIDIKDYVSKLSHSLMTNYKVDKNRIVLLTDIQELNLDIDTTIPLGLIVNELLTNILKYAFPQEQDGKVEVILREENGILLLRVRDNGIGYDPDAENDKEGSGFGLKMIKIFSKKLKAEYSIRNDSGTVVDLKIHNYKKAS